MKLNELAISHRKNSFLKEMTEHFKTKGISDENFVTEFCKNIMEDDDFDPFSHLQSKGKIDPEEDCVLTFSKPNEKLGKVLGAPSFDLPAGYTCPFADVCKSMAHRHGKAFKGSGGRKIKDLGDIRCYAASQEVQYPAVRKNRWTNYDLLRKFKGDVSGMKDLILRSIDYYERTVGKFSVLRIHSSGDFFSQEYFNAWVEVAKEKSNVLFYAYTKSLPFWKESRDDIPKNMRLVASEGGKADDMIDKEKFRKATIVKDTDEAKRKKLQIDLDDTIAALGDKDFALLLHGGQSKESGLGSQSMKNSKIAKEISAKTGASFDDIQKAIKKYTK